VVINGRDIRIDPWAVEYGAETPGVSLPAEDDAQVDVTVECADWQPITVPSDVTARPMLFVDGVRRIEQRLVVTGERVLHGAIGSYGIGAGEPVRLTPPHPAARDRRWNQAGPAPVRRAGDTRA
jgi:hypothetical protein